MRLCMQLYLHTQGGWVDGDADTVWAGSLADEEGKVVPCCCTLGHGVPCGKQQEKVICMAQWHCPMYTRQASDTVYIDHIW